MRERRQLLSEEAEREEAEEREKLRELDAKLRQLHLRRETLLERAEKLGEEQRTLAEAREGPRAAAEAAYEAQRSISREIARLQGERGSTRAELEERIARAREVRAEIPAADRLTPAKVREEIRRLEHDQQTKTLTIAQENALLARLRERTQLLVDLEARAVLIAEHEARRKEAEAAVRTARDALAELEKRIALQRSGRQAQQEGVRSELARQGSVIAQMRELGKQRREVGEKLDALHREIAILERQGNELVGRSRQRRDEARRTLAEFSGARRRAESTESLDRHAEATLEELKKRGRIRLG